MAEKFTKRVVQCGSCQKWYRKSRMYHVHFEGKERITTAIGVTTTDVDEDREVCPKCYESMGYIVGRVQDDNDDIESVFVTDPEFMKQEEILPGIEA